MSVLQGTGITSRSRCNNIVYFHFTLTICLLVCLQLIESNPSAPKHVERVYCGHLYHLQCLQEYMGKPPFGNKRCQTCNKLIFHHKWSLSDKLAEDRWAHEQARERELSEVEEFFK